MSSYNGVLYIGMTNNLSRRVCEHKSGLVDGFTKKYKCNNLVYFESSSDVKSIIAREKQIKRWSRDKKVWLIQQSNKEMKDLSTSPASPAGGLEMTN